MLSGPDSEVSAAEEPVVEVVLCTLADIVAEAFAEQAVDPL